MKNLVLGFVIGVLLVTSLAFAGLQFGKEYAISTEIRIVGAGDTVNEIAEEYFDKQDKDRNLNEWIYNVQAANNLVGRKEPLQIGEVLVIPLYKEKIRASGN